MTLFDIEMSYRKAIEELIENGGAMTEELELQMQFDEKAFSKKMCGYGLAIKEINGEVDLLDDAIAELTKKKKAREQTVTTMKGRMLQAMLAFDQEKIKTPFISIWIGKSKKLKVLHEHLIPAAYLTEVITQKVEGAKLKEAIENGLETDAAVVEETFNLQIR